MDENVEKKNRRTRQHQLAGGILLVLIGTTTLLQRWFDIGTSSVLLIGAAMLIWGSISRRTSWIIPGGVLSGIGLGILIMNGPWKFPVQDQNGIFLLCFALGWFTITLLTALFTCVQWWALIPGGIMGLIGGGILATHGSIHWMDLNLIYAILLILLGLSLLVYRSRPRR